MHRIWGCLFAGTMLASFLLFAIAPFVGWWMPRDVSTFGGGIDALFYVILAVTGVFFVLTETILIYCLFKFPYDPARKSQHTHGSHKLEIVWTIIPGVLLFVLAIVQIGVWADVKFAKNMPNPDGDTQQMEVTARQWEWRVRYPGTDRLKSWQADPKRALDFAANAHIDDVHLPNEIHVYKGTKAKPERVLVHLKTLDVLHSFFLPNCRLKQDAVPGKTIKVWFAVTEHNCERDSATGRWVELGYDAVTGKSSDPNMIWELACAEFCGSRHSMMRGKLYVHKDRADFEEWLKSAEALENQTRPTPAPANIVAER